MTLEDKRRLNERKFPTWEDLHNGGRKYWLDVKGKHGWKARYVKVVDAMENFQWTKAIGNYKEG